MSARRRLSPRAWRSGVWLALACGALVVVAGWGQARERVEEGAPGLERSGGLLLMDGRPFSGEVVARRPDGTVAETTSWEDGLRQGTARGWYSNGQLSWQRGYERGREQGVHEGWWEDGEPRFRYRFEAGLQEGDAFEWFPDGTPYRAFHYVAGKEEGRQRMWYADGSPRAHYVVRDGRRYGLPGTKGCTGGDVSDGAGV